MDGAARVWIDDANPIFRRGLAWCLREGGFVLAGESARFVPEPDLDRVDVLVFDLGEAGLGSMVRPSGRDGPPSDEVRLLGVVRSGGWPGEGTHGMCTVLDRMALTPAQFLDSLRSLAGAPGDATLSADDIKLLRLLAEGETLRRIAARLGSPPGAVEGLLADLLVRMRCRNPAQAVAWALREGVI